MAPNRPFDAVLLISFGGPTAPDEIRPFLANVLRGRRIPPARVEAVAHHYELFGGVSPITDITMRQAEGLRTRLEQAELPVYVGMRNWHPFVDDTLTEMWQAGHRRVLGLTLAAHHCYSSCGQYKQNVVQARDTLRAATNGDIEVTYVSGWHTSPGYVEACATRIADSRSRLPAPLRAGAKLLFTAHSIPISMAETCRYEAELKETCELVARRLDWNDWALVYQSRSGRPEDPWLEPDVCDYIQTESTRGLESVVISPVGFVADHVEVLYDLDREAAEACADAGVTMQRAPAVNDDPSFLDALAEVVLDTCARYRTGRPLAIVPHTPPARTEPPPPVRSAADYPAVG